MEQGIVPVTPGEVLTVAVGGKGDGGSEDHGGPGGYGGGGYAAPNTSDIADSEPGCGTGGGGGGGGTFLWDGRGSLVMVAGGGGGGSIVRYSTELYGGDGTASGGGKAAPEPPGPGETPASAGQGPAGGPGVFGTGGDGGGGCFVGGGGGGGGYYGGGGGAGGAYVTHSGESYCDGGGGYAGDGSNYASAAVTNVQNGPDGGLSGGSLTLTYSPGIVVNSTALTSDDPTSLSRGDCNTTPSAPVPTCTLPAAIEVTNKLGGGTITFDIRPGGSNTFDGSVPQIKAPNAVLKLTAPAVIDGTTQPGAGRVELSGTAGDGLKGPFWRGLWVGIGAAGSTIEGMVINGFSDQLFLQGGGDAIRDNYLGTNAHGTTVEWDPLGTNKDKQLLAQIDIDLLSSGNQIGGPGQGNVFGLGWSSPGSASAVTRPAAAIYDGSSGPGTGNVVQDNAIGVVPGTDAALIDPVPPGAVGLTFPEPGLDLRGADTVGGALPGEGNMIAGAQFSGSSVVQGNTFYGWVSVTGPATIGGPTTNPGAGAGNTFDLRIPAGSPQSELSVFNGGATVQGNKFTDSGSTSVAGAIFIGTSHATVGGDVADLGNLIEDQDYGRVGAITVAGDGNLIEHNIFRDNNAGGGAVEVDSGDGNTITQNVMTGNSWGITLGNHGYLSEKSLSVDPNLPNNSEIYPVLASTASTPSGTDVSLTIEQAGTVTIELYSEKSCQLQADSPGQGEDYLGSQTVSSGLGSAFFKLKFEPTPAGQAAITATATGRDGSTSEFSPCLNINSKAPNPL
jgi:hypothetical protein